MGRSGGSLLSRLLDGHPEVASFPYEPRFGKIDPRKHRKLSESFPDPLAGSVEDVLRRHRRLDHALSIVSGARPSKNEFPDYDEARFREALGKPLPPDAGPADFIHAFSEAVFLSHPYYRDRWQDVALITWHSSMSQLWSEDLLRIEGLHLLYIVRHPLDVLASYLRSKGRKVPITPEIELLGWCDCVLRAARDRARMPDRVSLVRYEDMVSDTDAFASDLASKLGIADSPALRRPSLLGEPWAGNGSYERYQAVSTESIGRFTGYFSVEQIDRCAEILDGWLEPMGYRLEKPYFEQPFSLERINAELDPLQVSRDLILYCESRFKGRSRELDQTGFWPNPYEAKQRGGVSAVIRKKARALLPATESKGSKS